MLYRPNDPHIPEPDGGGFRSWLDDLLARFPSALTIAIMVALVALAIYAILTVHSTICACDGARPTWP